MATLWWRGYLKIGSTFINPETLTMKTEKTVTDNIFFDRVDLKNCGSNVIIGDMAQLVIISSCRLVVVYSLMT